jgi:hypothetical protein
LVHAFLKKWWLESMEADIDISRPAVWSRVSLSVDGFDSSLSNI